MKAMIVRNVHILVLMTGVALAAAGGARLGESDYAVAAGEGQTALSGGAQSVHARGAVDPGERFRDWANGNLDLFLAGIILIVGGAVMTRRRQRHERQALSAGESSFSFEDELARLARVLAGISQSFDAEAVDTLDIRNEIERLEISILEPLFENRQRLELQYGLAGYVSVIGPLAGTERFLNRTWTTLVDHHVSEARASLTQAVNSTLAAQEALAKLDAG